MRASCWIVVVGIAAVVSACAPAGPPRETVYTPAHSTVSSAVREFFGVRVSAEQPIPFPHKTHIEKAMLKCTDYCHESVTKGPRAGLPSVKTCMICHDAIATDRPLIQQVADYSKRGVDIPWQRVYGFTRTAHVRFNHAPQIIPSVLVGYEYSIALENASRRLCFGSERCAARTFFDCRTWPDSGA